MIWDGFLFLVGRSHEQLDAANFNSVISVNDFQYLTPCIGGGGRLVSCMDGWSGLVGSGLGWARAGAPKRWMAAHGMGVVCGSTYMSYILLGIHTKWSFWAIYMQKMGW